MQSSEQVQRSRNARSTPQETRPGTLSSNAASQMQSHSLSEALVGTVFPFYR